MAKKLFKLAASAPHVTVTDTNYYYSVTAAITVAAGNSFQLSRAKWSTGSGGTPASFAKTSRGYYNLFINGVLQQSIFYSVLSGSNIHLLNPGSVSYTIPRSSPITLGLAASSISQAEVVIP